MIRFKQSSVWEARWEGTETHSKVDVDFYL